MYMYNFVTYKVYYWLQHGNFKSASKNNNKNNTIKKHEQLEKQ